jgi:predicted glycosyltransferase
MKSAGVNYHTLLKKRVGKGKASILFKGMVDIVNQGLALFKFVISYKPDIMFGTDYSITHIGKLTRVPSIVFNEDDFNINKFFCKLSYPLANCIVSPQVCDVGKYSHKKISYSGYQKLAYLHPNVFIPDEAILQKYLLNNRKYFLIRLVSFTAGHDIEMKHGGISEPVLDKLISILKHHGDIYISSELSIPARYSPYKLNIDVKDIHHVMAFASLIVADSQSMIVEASVMGIPSIRFNSFVGKISVLEELQNKYELTYGIKNIESDLLFQKIEQLLAAKNLSDQFNEKKKIMLSQKIDVSAFITWFIENYPESKKILINNPDYQYNFK